MVESFGVNQKVSTEPTQHHSTTGRAAASAYVTLPSPNQLPPGPLPTDNISGYLYIEGWTTPNGNDSEAGFLFSAVNDWYTAYLRPAGSAELDVSKVGVSGGSRIYLMVMALTSGVTTEP